MSREVGVQQMALEALAQQCAQETDLYFKQKIHDTRYCFELFRRAIQEGSKAAWDLICIQYDALVTGWVTRHYGFASSGEEAQDFVNEAFRKIFSTITAERFGRFSDLGALLRYLKLCVHSVIVDFMRATDYANLSAWEETSENVRMEDPSPEEQAMDVSERQKLWELLLPRLHDEKERLVIYGSFVLDLKPQELLDQFSNVFSSIDEIYRVKQNVIARLRRDIEFRKLFGMGD
jgi:DNA-directed RNA polymerase specialized sigma24 family protein